jgi:hypothetical protein
MMFRGRVVLPLADVPAVKSKTDFEKTPRCQHRRVFTQLPTLTDDYNLAKESFDELAKRKDEASKSFVDFDEKCRKEKRIVMNPLHYDWAAGSGSSFFSSGSCLFPRATKN